MKFSTALALAAALHAAGLAVLWKTWPAAAPPGEVVPLELRAVEPPAPPPQPPVETPPAAAGGGGAAKRRTTRMTLALAPEPAGDVPVAPSPVAETLNNSEGGGGTGGGGATGGGGGGGGGNGGGVGKAGGVGVTPGPVAPKIDLGPLRAQAMERIRQQRRYPELARRRRIEGTVTVGFRVAADGGITGARVKRSVDELLDEAALEAVRAAAPLPAALSQDGELEVLLQFYLRP